MARSRKPKTGRSDTPIKGVTITVRGPHQFQARFRKTGHPSKSETFETRAEAEKWGIEQVNKANRGDATPSVKRQAQPTLGEVIDQYIEMAAPALKGEAQAVSQARQLRKTDLAKFAIGNVRASDVIEWLNERRGAKVRASQFPDSDSANSRTAVSLMSGQFDGVGHRVPLFYQG